MIQIKVSFVNDFKMAIVRALRVVLHSIVKMLKVQVIGYAWLLCWFSFVTKSTGLKKYSTELNVVSCMTHIVCVWHSIHGINSEKKHLTNKTGFDIVNFSHMLINYIYFDCDFLFFSFAEKPMHLCLSKKKEMERRENEFFYQLA